MRDPEADGDTNAGDLEWERVGYGESPEVAHRGSWETEEYPTCEIGAKYPACGIRVWNVRGLQIGMGNLQVNTYEYQVDQPIIDFATVLSRAAVRDALKALAGDPNNPNLQRKVNELLARGPLFRQRPELYVERSEKISKTGGGQRSNVIDAFIFNSEGVQVGDSVTQRNNFVYFVVPTVNAAQLLADDPAVRSAVIDCLCSPDEEVAGDLLRNELEAALESAVLSSPDVHTKGDLIHFSAYGRLDVDGGDGVAISIGKKGRQKNEAHAVVAVPDTVVKSLQEKSIGQPIDLPTEVQVEIPSVDQAGIQPTPVNQVGIQLPNQEQVPSLTGQSHYQEQVPSLTGQSHYSPDLSYPARGDDPPDLLDVKSEISPAVVKSIMGASLGSLGHTGTMTGRRVVLMITGLLIAGVGVVFLILGLDQADKAASVTGAVVGLAGLGFSIWTYMKNASLTKNANIHVANSTGVQFGRACWWSHIIQNNNLGTDATKKNIGSTQLDGEGQHRDGSKSGSGFSAPQD